MDKEFIKELIVVKGKVIEQERGFYAKAAKDLNYEQAAKMVKRHYDQNPDDVMAHFTGKDAILKILSQPGCVGIRTFHGLNEMGIRQLIFIGVDSQGTNIINYETLNAEGQLEVKKGTIVSEAMKCPPYCGPDKPSDSFWW